jgi:hypothetical protein|tara:strand:- start:1014 stop:1316 length:303 start_codon:yes stop_codon:yes gene_type:complete
MSLFRIFRPELSDATIKKYNKELRFLKDDFGMEDEVDLLTALNDISLHSLNLEHILKDRNKSQKQARLAIYRNLLNIFDTLVKPKDYEIIDLLILEERLK